MYEEITAQARTAVTELLEQAKLKPGALLVIGCSSSEMVGKRIGKGSSEEAAEAAFAGIYPVLREHGVFLAVQCCEHLNRALVVEETVAEKYGLEAFCWQITGFWHGERMFMRHGTAWNPLSITPP